MAHSMTAFRQGPVVAAKSGPSSDITVFRSRNEVRLLLNR